MLLFRRLLVIPLGLLLFAALFSATLLQRLDVTVLNPAFYKQRLSDAKFYPFLLGGFLDSAISEVGGVSPDSVMNQDNGGLIGDLGLSSERVAQSVNTAVSANWLRNEVEAGIDQVVPYISGDTDEFEINLDFKHQAEILLVESKALQRESKSYEFVVGEFVDPIIDDALAEETLFGLRVPPEEMKETVRGVVTDEWIHDQIDVFIDGFIPYMIGDEDTFRVEIPLNDRAEIAIGGLKKLIRDVNGYDALYEEVIEAQVLEAAGDSVELPGGLALGKDEMASILRRVVPPDWIEVKAEAIIDGSKDYLIGNEDEFSATISLIETKARSQEIVIDVATTKVLRELEDLPECSEPLVSEDFNLIRFDQIPDCIPSDVNVAALYDLVAQRVSGVVTPLIVELIPDEVTFTNTDLRETLLEIGGQEGLDQFDRARELIKEGWVYTDEDLRYDLSENFSDGGEDDDVVALLDDTRLLISEGWSYTETDLNGSLERSGSLEFFEQARNVFKWVSVLPWLLIPASMAIVVGIGFLGGTTWRARVVWASGALTTTSLLFLIIWSVVYGNVIRPQFKSLLDTFSTASSNGEGSSGVQGLLFEKIGEIFESSLDIFAIGISNVSITLLIIGLVVFFVSYFWDSISANFERMSVRARQYQVRSRAVRS